MARPSSKPFPELDLEEAATYTFRLFRVVGADFFTRKDAARFLGINVQGKKFPVKIFPSLLIFGLLHIEQRGRHVRYQVSEVGRVMALRVLEENPDLSGEPMTPAGREYLERRLSEIVAEMELADTIDNEPGA
ncbi:hypothetical protein MXD62_16920 [Frankia sp. Mgl5]|uniref:hypothetical protein n=1 Tax=Frankia sp. Mgl5 TaxID=2933793 RepID=UPI00200BEA37|nr:hypothetical protein [Frankia sp. Mgl5]MCK9928840.1 hypothetical protein [Frankia sp. Mgl5]